MALFRRNKTPVIGIDLGSGYIKAVQFKLKDKKDKKDKSTSLEIVDFASLPTPDSAIVDGKIEKQSVVKKALQDLMAFRSFQGNRVVANASGKFVIVRELSIKDLPEQELEEAVKWEASSFLPSSIENFAYDYQIMNNGELDENGKLSIIFAASPFEIIKSIQSLFVEMHFDLVAVEVEPFASLRLLNYMGNTIKNTNLIMFINLGHTTSTINIVDKGIVRFSRTINWGGAQLTKEIAAYFGVSVEEAEVQKVNKVDFIDLNSEISALAQKSIKDVIMEIKRSLSFYFSKYNNEKPIDTVIVLEGGTANAKNIDKFIEIQIGYPTFVDRTFSTMASYDQSSFSSDYLVSVAPFLAIAAGLALEEYDLPFVGGNK